MPSIGISVLSEVVSALKNQKSLAERALAQVSDEKFFAQIDPETNTLAMMIKHLSGSTRSRWTDFLTSDGEKPNRDRDNEFVISSRDSRESLMESWDESWDIAFQSIHMLSADDLTRVVTIRSEPHTVLKALLRYLQHATYHVGQIVMLAKHLSHDKWGALSIPRGQSERFNEFMRDRYSDDPTVE